MIVKSGHVELYIVHIIGLLIIYFLAPHTLSVNY